MGHVLNVLWEQRATSASVEGGQGDILDTPKLSDADVYCGRIAAGARVYLLRDNGAASDGSRSTTAGT